MAAKEWGTYRLQSAETFIRSAIQSISMVDRPGDDSLELDNLIIDLMAATERLDLLMKKRSAR